MDSTRVPDVGYDISTQPHTCSSYCSDTRHAVIEHATSEITREDILALFPKPVYLPYFAATFELVDARTAPEVPSANIWDHMRGASPLEGGDDLTEAWLLIWEKLGS